VWTQATADRNGDEAAALRVATQRLQTKLLVSEAGEVSPPPVFRYRRLRDTGVV
jgi:hypothetical protein